MRPRRLLLWSALLAASFVLHLALSWQAGRELALPGAGAREQASVAEIRLAPQPPERRARGAGSSRIRPRWSRPRCCSPRRPRSRRRRTSTLRCAPRRGRAAKCRCRRRRRASGCSRSRHGRGRLRHRHRQWPEQFQQPLRRLCAGPARHRPRRGVRDRCHGFDGLGAGGSEAARGRHRRCHALAGAAHALRRGRLPRSRRSRVRGARTAPDLQPGEARALRRRPAAPKAAARGRKRSMPGSRPR